MKQIIPIAAGEETFYMQYFVEFLEFLSILSTNFRFLYPKKCDSTPYLSKM
jgi:hypothetical protein